MKTDIYELMKYIKKHTNKPEIIYKDSNKPEVLRDYDTQKIRAVAFNKDGKRYLFSNNEGHIVIYNNARINRPMTKKEFYNIKNMMITSAINTDDETEVLENITSLDFNQGHANATFEVLTSISKPEKVKSLALNINLMRYVYNLEDQSLLIVNREKETSGYMIDSKEKDNIVNTMLKSKTMTKKINEVNKQ